MTFEDFIASLDLNSPPAQASRGLQALWLDHKGMWEKAHEMIQDEEDSVCAAIHAYLHRKEGDSGNANYWYRNANRKPFQGSLTDEWNSLGHELCEHSSRS